MNKKVFIYIVIISLVVSLISPSIFAKEEYYKEDFVLDSEREIESSSILNKDIGYLAEDSESNFLFDNYLLNNDSFYVPGELIIKFKDDLKIEKSYLFNRLVSVGVSSIDVLNREYGVFFMEDVFSDSVNPVFLDNYFKIKLSNFDDFYSVMMDYNRLDCVEFAEPNYIYNTCLIPDDPFFDQQWSLHQSNDCDIDAPEAWEIETGDSNVVIAVIDTGVEYTHNDLIDNIWHDLSGNPGKDFVDIDTDYYTSHGYELISDEDYTGVDYDPMDKHGHGTHCAGIAAGVGNNNIGITGVAWNSKIMPVRAGFKIKKDGDTYGIFENDDIANAIYYAVDNGVDIISMSFGGSSISSTVENAINYAINNRVICVAAAGNSASSIKSYPAGFDEVIAVAATDDNDKKPFFSNYGKWIDISAPGEDVYSTYISNSYKSLSGTSMACPVVAGVVGVIKSYFSSYNTDQIISQLKYTADDIDDLNPRFKNKIGTGRVNIKNALTTNPHPVIDIIDYSYVDDDNGYIEPGEQIVLQLSLENLWETATNVIINAYIYDTYINVVGGGSATIDIFPEGSSRNITIITFYVDPDAPLGYNNIINIDINDDSGYSESYYKNIQIIKFQNGWPKDIYEPYANVFSNVLTYDFNGDDLKEIIALGTKPHDFGWSSEFMNGDNYLYVFNQDGSNYSNFPIRIEDPNDYNFPAPSNINAPAAIGDIDSDGIADIIFNTIHENKIYAYNSQGELLDGWPVEYEDNGNFPLIQDGSPVIADLNDDGHNEVLIRTARSDLFYVFNGNGEELWNIALGKSYSTPSVCDLNNDGFLEIVLANHDGSIFVYNKDKVLLSQYSHIPQVDPNYDTYIDLLSSSPIICDLDNDDIIEIVIGMDLDLVPNNGGSHESYGHLLILEYVNDNLVLQSAFSYEDNNGIRNSVLVSDIDTSSPGLEIAFGSWNGGVYLTNYNGDVYENWPVEAGGVFSWTLNNPLTSIDIDNDGEQEVLFNSYSGDKVFAYNKNGSLVDGFPLNIGEDYYLNSPTVSDIDNDGGMELLVLSDTSGILSIVDTSAGFSDWPTYHHDVQHTGCYKEIGEGNNPPDVPDVPIGRSYGEVGVSYIFNTTATDPDNDNIRYGWDWDGDNNIDEWTGFYPSNQIVSISHIWNKAGSYYVKVKAEDIHNAESLWSSSKIVRISNDSENDSPIAENDTITVQQNSYYNSIDVLYNDYDPDNDIISIDSIIIPPIHGSVSINGDIILYSPDHGYNGIDFFKYKITDGNDGYDTAIVNIIVGEKPLEIAINIDNINKDEITADVVNKAEDSILNVEWSINVQGGIFNYIDVYNEGIISSLGSDKEKAVSSGDFGFGLGVVKVCVVVVVDGEIFKKDTNGIIIGSIIFII